jgi:hypothetical protein
MTTASDIVDTREASDHEWYWIAVVAGSLALFCYFFSSVFDILPSKISRVLFYSFGPCLTLGAFAAGVLLRANSRSRPFFQVGILFVCVAGIAVNMMAVIQDSNFTMMGRAIAEAELEATKDALERVLWGINWVQLSFDIVFDIWIAGGCFFLALGTFRYLRQRILGGIGMLIAAMVLGINFATLPHPPAESGLFDPGPLCAIWLGIFLGLVMLWHRRGKLS